MKRISQFVFLAMVAAFVAACSNEPSDSSTSTIGGNGTPAKKPTVAFVTNLIASFWLVAESGTQQAAVDFDVNVEVRMPPDGVADQKRMVQELLTMGVDGISISPIDPDNQADLLNEIADHTIFITQDSDAPKSKRLCYVGVDNYVAGRMCGQLVKEAMPDGGSVMILVGRLEQANAKLRRQGVIDELLGRDNDSNRYDQPGEVLKGEKYTILDTRTDQGDRVKAKSNAQDAIAKYPDLGCMVGLFAYNPPLILDAVTEAGKLDQIKMVAFDEADATLQGIVDGHIYGTIVQDPYNYGYYSIKILAALVRGDKSVIPENKILEFPPRRIVSDNVEEFWTQLKDLVAKAKSGKKSSEPEPKGDDAKPAGSSENKSE